MNHLKGESLNVDFDKGIKLEFHGAKVTSDGCLLEHRDLDDALGLLDSVPTNFHDNRKARKKYKYSCIFEIIIYSQKMLHGILC